MLAINVTFILNIIRQFYQLLVRCAREPPAKSRKYSPVKRYQPKISHKRGGSLATVDMAFFNSSVWQPTFEELLSFFENSVPFIYIIEAAWILLLFICYPAVFKRVHGA